MFSQYALAILLLDTALGGPVSSVAAPYCAVSLPKMPGAGEKWADIRDGSKNTEKLERKKLKKLEKLEMKNLGGGPKGSGRSSASAVPLPVAVAPSAVGGSSGDPVSMADAPWRQTSTSWSQDSAGTHTSPSTSWKASDASQWWSSHAYPQADAPNPMADVPGADAHAAPCTSWKASDVSQWWSSHDHTPADEPNPIDYTPGPPDFRGALRALDKRVCELERSGNVKSAKILELESTLYEIAKQKPEVSMADSLALAKRFEQIETFQIQKHDELMALLKGNISVIEKMHSEVAAAVAKVNEAESNIELLGAGFLEARAEKFLKGMEVLDFIKEMNFTKSDATSVEGSIHFLSAQIAQLQMACRWQEFRCSDGRS